MLDGIDRLRKANIPVHLQSTVTNDMMDDLPAIASYARERDLPFIYSHVLKANRLCDAEAVAELTAEEQHFNDIVRQVYEINGFEYREAELVDTTGLQAQSTGILCGAGNNSFHINWKGEMTPCVTFDPFRAYPLRDGVRQAWKEVWEWAQTIPQIEECQTCAYRNRCHHCIALHWGDTGEFGKVAPRLCYKIQHGIKD